MRINWLTRNNWQLPPTDSQSRTTIDRTLGPTCYSNIVTHNLQLLEKHQKYANNFKIYLILWIINIRQVWQSIGLYLSISPLCSIGLMNQTIQLHGWRFTKPDAVLVWSRMSLSACLGLSTFYFLPLVLNGSCKFRFNMHLAYCFSVCKQPIVVPEDRKPIPMDL